MQKFAAVGARTSSDDADRDSIQAQITECKLAAEGEGFVVPDWAITREDGVSGSLPADARAELQRGLELLRSGRVHVYFWRGPDRLGRRADTGQLTADAAIFGGGIRFAQLPRIDDDIAETMMRGSFTSFAEVERKMIYRRTSAGRNRRARSGEGPGIGTLPPWLAWSGSEFVLVEPAATETQRLILDEARVGGHLLAEQQDMHPSKLYWLLHAPIIAGLRCVLPLRPSSVEAEYRMREQLARRRVRRDALQKVSAAATVEEAVEIAEREGLIVQRVPPLISWEKYAEIQARLGSKPSGTRGRPPTKDLPLQGRVFCGKHGLAFTPERSGGGGGYRGHTYGVCTARRARGPQARKHGVCDYPRIPWTEDTKRGGRSLLSLVSEKLDEMMSSPDGFRKAADDSLAVVRGRIDQLEAETGDVESEISRHKERRAKIGMLWADGSIDDARWKAERERIDKQIAAAEKRAATAGDRLQQLAQARRVADVLKKLQARGVAALTATVGAESLDQRAARIDLKVLVYPDRLVLEAAVPIDDVPFDGVRDIAVSSRRGGWGSPCQCSERRLEERGRRKGRQIPPSYGGQARSPLRSSAPLRSG